MPTQTWEKVWSEEVKTRVWVDSARGGAVKARGGETCLQSGVMEGAGFLWCHVFHAKQKGQEKRGTSTVIITRRRLALEWNPGPHIFSVSFSLTLLTCYSLTEVLRDVEILYHFTSPLDLDFCLDLHQTLIGFFADPFHNLPSSFMG